MAAGVTSKLWDVHAIVELIEGYLAEKIVEKKESARLRIEQSYSQYGEALGGKGVKI
jgi:hypothetical protein